MYCKLSNKKYPPKKRGKRKRNTHLTSLPDRTEITPHNATTVCVFESAIGWWWWVVVVVGVTQREKKSNNDECTCRERRNKEKEETKKQ